MEWNELMTFYIVRLQRYLRVKQRSIACQVPALVFELYSVIVPPRAS